MGLPLTTSLTLKAGRASYGIHRGRERIAGISTAIMDQAEVGGLFAAAPDMLAALMTIVNSDMAMREEDEGRTSPALDYARAAISKALGETK